MATIEIDINNFPIANELLDTFKFKENNHLYQNLFERELGYKYGNEFRELDGYVDIIVLLVQDYHLIKSNVFIKEEDKAYIEKNIKNGALQIEYSGRYKYELSLDYIYDAGSANECTVKLEMEINNSWEIKYLTMNYDPQANNKYITMLALKSSHID
jgi:hypothetical protein